MMTSVIPARLEFQCGHAALVSLPRVKGESSAQRSNRIALEKSGAQARSCDFCAPRLDLVSEIVAADVAALSAAPQRLDLVPEIVAADVAALSAAPQRLEVVADVVVAEVVAVSAVAPPVVEEVLAVTVVVAEEAAPQVSAPVSKTRARRVRPSAPAVQTTSNGHAASLRSRFVVRFQAEAVVEAADIREALRKAASLGATEVVAITSEP